MIRNTTKLQKFGWVLFILYLIALTYFLFFVKSFSGFLKKVCPRKKSKRKKNAARHNYKTLRIFINEKGIVYR